jgi:single-stranded DNA-binding protein
MTTINLGVVQGTCSDVPDVRELTSGRRLATVSVRVKTGEEPATSVPVTVWDPPAWIETIEAGEELLVVGRIQRRFFRSATGATAAKVELVADALARTGDRRRVAAVRRRAERALTLLGE